MPYVGRSTDKLSNVEVLDNITFDGSSSYTLQKNSVNFTPSSANTLLVSIDGVVQAGNFTVSGSTIDFGTAVAGTSTCDFILHYGVGLITSVSDGTVTTAKLGDDAVTNAKINDDLISGATALTSEPADTDEFLVSDAGTIKRIDYSLIKSNPRHTLLATQTISSSVSSFDMTDVMTDTYNNYLLVFQGMRVSNDDVDIRITFFTGSGTGGHITSGYRFAHYELRTDGTNSGNSSTSSAYYLPNKSGIGNGSNETANGQFQFFDMRNTTKRSLYGEMHHVNNSNQHCTSRSVGGSDFSDTPCTGLRLQVSSGDITHGTFKLYGQE